LYGIRVLLPRLNGLFPFRQNFLEFLGQVIGLDGPHQVSLVIHLPWVPALVQISSGHRALLLWLLVFRKFYDIPAADV
jgi:hypothetical protein